MSRTSSSIFLFAALLFSLAFTAPPAHAAVIATYWFPGADPAGDLTAPLVAHATLTPVTRVGLNAANRFNELASSNYTSSTSLDPTDSYIEFTITADPGYALHLQSLSFYYTRVDQNANRTGPLNGAVRASFESFADGSGTGDIFYPQVTEHFTTWDFTDWTSPDGGSATFRIYGWRSLGNSSPSMQLVIDDISINGTVSPNPEPSTLSLLLPLAASLAATRRPRR